MFDHFLFTRFNLRQASWTNTKNNTPVLTEEWLKNRFELFENYCLPSVRSQTNKDFKWLVFFDIESPLPYKEKIMEYQKDCAMFQPFFVQDMSYFFSTIQDELKKSTAPYIITSRIDNDDCISQHYIEEVQRNFDQQNYLAIDFSDGYTLQVAPKVKVGKRHHIYNPFISLIERNENPKGIWSMKKHSDWKRIKNITRIPNKRVWMSIIHFENKVNEFIGYGNVDLASIFEEFVIEDKIKAQLAKNQIPISSWPFLSIKNKVSSHWHTFNKDLKKALKLYN